MTPKDLTGSSRELQYIADEIRRMYAGHAWHGPSIQEALAEVTAGMAIAPSLPGAHNIFELTHHLAAWIGETTRRLRGGSPGEPADGDFPAKETTLDDATWSALLARLHARHEELIAAVLGFDAMRLDTVVGDADPEGKGTTYRMMLHGVVSHDAYHAGQIVLLRRALG